MFMMIWIACIIATLVIADQKKLNAAGFFFLALFTGPLAVLIIVLTPAQAIPLNKGATFPEANNLQEAKQKLQGIQFDLLALQERTKNLEALVARLSGATAPAPEAKSSVEDLILPARVVEPVIRPAAVSAPAAPAEPARKSDMELDFGRNWLSKIGVAVLALGIAFLISYTFKYFGPFLKIAFGYAVGVAVFVIGFKLEAKERLVNYGRVLLGGAWAIIYFTTYAMHHFDASRIIASQSVDLALLALVIAGMMGHVLKYKNEGMMSVVLFVAYLTSTIGQITSFTILSSLFLAVLVVFLAYKFQWVKTLAMAILLTYAIHLIWVEPNIFGSVRHTMLLGMATPDYYGSMNLVFLTCYWLVFLAGIHLARMISDPVLVRTLAAVNFGNIALYSALSFPLLNRLFHTQRAELVLFAGVVYLVLAIIMKARGRRKMYVSDIVAAIFAITFAISLKFLPTPTLILWMIEAPLLLIVGIHFQERLYRYFSYVLSVVIGLRLMSSWVFGYMPDVHFLGWVLPWYGFMSFWAALSMAMCFGLAQYQKADVESDVWDRLFDQVFSFAAFLYLTIWLWSFVRQPWTAFSLGLEGFLLLGASIVLGRARFRAYAYGVLIMGAGIFLLESVTASSEFLKWLILGFDVLVVFAFYYVLKTLKQQKTIELFYEYEAELVFAAGLMLLVVAIHQYAAPQWISLSLGFASVAVILTGFFNGDKTERLGGMALLALTLGRVVFVELSGLDIIFKIITLIVLGVLFLGVSYIYNRFNVGKK